MSPQNPELWEQQNLQLSILRGKSCGIGSLEAGSWGGV